MFIENLSARLIVLRAPTDGGVAEAELRPGAGRVYVSDPAQAMALRLSRFAAALESEGAIRISAEPDDPAEPEPAKPATKPKAGGRK